MNYYTDMEKCYFVVPFQVSCEFTESCYGAIIIIVFLGKYTKTSLFNSSRIVHFSYNFSFHVNFFCT